MPKGVFGVVKSSGVLGVIKSSRVLGVVKSSPWTSRMESLE